MIGWDACTLEPCVILRWIECHPGTAGWLQAIGTLAAIFAAIILSRSDAVARRHIFATERGQRATAVAARIVPFLAQVSNRLDEIEVLNASGDYGLELAMFNMGDAIVRYSVPVFNDRHVLDQISALSVADIRNLVMLIAVTDDYNPYISSAMPMARTLDAKERENYLADMKRRLNAMRMLSRELLAEMNDLLKTPKR